MIDSRAGINPIPETVVNPQKDGASSIWVDRVIATELALFTLLGGAGKAEGAAQCEGELGVFGVKFADHPNIGTRRVIDMTDIYLGNERFGLVELYDQKGKEAFDGWDKKDPAKKPKPIASKDMEDRGAYSFTRVHFSGVECDEDNGQAKKVWVKFANDKTFAMAPEIVRNKGAQAFLGGRDEHRVSELQGFINDPNFTVEKVGDVIKRVSKKEVGVEIPFIDIEQLKGDAKAISEANRESLRRQAAKLIEEQAEERKKGGGSAGRAELIPPGVTDLVVPVGAALAGLGTIVGFGWKFAKKKGWI